MASKFNARLLVATFRVLLALPLLAEFASTAAAQDREPDKALMRRAYKNIDTWIDARQEVFPLCTKHGCCEGTGVLRQPKMGPGGRIEPVLVFCPKCQGTSRRFQDKSYEEIVAAFAPGSQLAPRLSVGEVDAIHRNAHKHVLLRSVREERAVISDIQSLWSQGAMARVAEMIKLIPRKGADGLKKISYEQSQDAIWFAIALMREGERFTFVQVPEVEADSIAQSSAPKLSRALKDWPWQIIDPSEKEIWIKRTRNLRAAVSERAEAQFVEIRELQLARRSHILNDLAAQKTNTEPRTSFDEKNFGEVVEESYALARALSSPEMESISIAEDLLGLSRYLREERRSLDMKVHPKDLKSAHLALLDSSSFRGTEAAKFIQESIDWCDKRLATLQRVETEITTILKNPESCRFALESSICQGLAWREPYAFDLPIAEELRLDVSEKRIVLEAQASAEGEEAIAALVELGRLNDAASRIKAIKTWRAGSQLKSIIDFLRGEDFRKGSDGQDDLKANEARIAIALQFPMSTSRLPASSLMYSLHGHCISAIEGSVLERAAELAQAALPVTDIDDLVDAHLILVLARLGRGEDLTTESLRDLEGIAGGDAFSMLRFARILANQDFGDLALRFSGNCNDLNDEVLGTSMLQSIVSLADGRLDDAGEALEQVLRAAPEHVNARAWSAVLQARRAQNEKAYESLKQVLAEAPDSRIALASLAIVSATASPDHTASFCDDYIERFDDSPFVRIQRAELRDASAPQKAQIDRDRANILLSQPCPSIELRAALHPNVMREAYYGLTLDTFVHGFNAIYLFRRGQWGPALAELGKTVMSTSRGKAFAHRFLDEVQVAVGPESPLQPTIAVLRGRIR